MEAKLYILLLNNLVKKNHQIFITSRDIPEISILFFCHIDYFGKSMASFGGTFLCSLRK